MAQTPARAARALDKILGPGARALDGGTGEELLRRGLPDDRATWSAAAVVREEHHELLVDVHKSFLKAGAAMITVNNYGITPGVGFSRDEVLKHTRVAAELARRAAREFGSGAVGGSLPPLVESYRPDLVQPHDDGVEMYRAIGTVLHPYVDCFLAETISSVEEMSQAVEAVATLDLEPVRPLLCSWTVRRGGLLRSGEPVATAVDDLLARKAPLGAILFNCSEPEAITEALTAISPGLRARLVDAGVQLGAYANRLTPIASDWSLAESTEPQALRDDLSPETYCDSFAKPWVTDLGVSLVGGCCGITPAHIVALRKFLDSVSS